MPSLVKMTLMIIMRIKMILITTIVIMKILRIGRRRWKEFSRRRQLCDGSCRCDRRSYRPRTKKFVRINEILMMLSENKRKKECLSEIKYLSSHEMVCTVGLADAVGEDEEKVEAVNVRLLILTHTLTIS